MSWNDWEGKRVFLSGPITGYEDYNKPAFEKAERDIRERGASHVYNPVRNAPEGGEPVKRHEHYMLLTLHCLTQMAWDSTECKPIFDLVAMLPGWQLSMGAKIEKAVAHACGIKVVEL